MIGIVSKVVSLLQPGVSQLGQLLPTLFHAQVLLILMVTAFTGWFIFAVGFGIFSKMWAHPN